MNILRAALTATVLLCASPGIGQVYRAIGSEPIWSVTIDRSHIRFRNIAFRIETYRTPARRPTRHGFAYVIRRYRFEITRGPCDEVENGRDYADNFRIVDLRDGHVYLGCGGPVLLPPRLAYTGWQVRAVGGARVRGVDAPVLEFSDGTLEIRSGCWSLTGPFGERGRTLRPGTIVARQREGCTGPRMPHEAELMRLFGRPVVFRYPVDGNSLELSGSGIIVSLERT